MTTTTLPTSHLHTLMNQRRDMHLEHQSARSQHSKQIKREIRAIKRLERRSQISQILSEYKNLKSIAGLKSQRKKELICGMVATNGQNVYDRQSIADVFANFYEQLYEDNHKTKSAISDSVESIEDFTSKELSDALRQLKTGKAPDANNICAEMLKSGGSKLREVVLICFNGIIKPSGETPQEWHKTLIKVLHKSGDTRLPQNYRPIATIPLLYKLFSRILYNRLEPILDAEQSSDQAGFRKHRSTVDHLFTTVLVQEAGDEWRVPIWVAAVDFKKAFDSVKHAALWKSLRDQKVPEGYIRLLEKMYDEQIGVVRTECLSKEFRIAKGVKQGDPLSSLLFNSASENIMRKLKLDWEIGGYGIKMSSSHEKTNELEICRRHFVSIRFTFKHWKNDRTSEHGGKKVWIVITPRKNEDTAQPLVSVEEHANTHLCRWDADRSFEGGRSKKVSTRTKTLLLGSTSSYFMRLEEILYIETRAHRKTLFSQ